MVGRVNESVGHIATPSIVIIILVLLLNFQYLEPPYIYNH